MNDPGECEHDFRRFGYRDLNPKNEQDRLLWVICWRCGRTPVGLGQMGHQYKLLVNGDWPKDVRVTNWEMDDYGPYVESEKVEAGGSDD